ncbi:usherin-like [Lytechinus variegatus]|uniref:usherin-like n=1 Tax=Lytechinus variegatus TaxID=7654 RepID=UPI001BB0FF61|nr:usherin-like [Lytechinus variegatus]
MELTRANKMEPFVTFISWMFVCVIGRAAAQGSFPDLFNAGEGRTISTEPPVGTCGYNPNTGDAARSGFCRSSTISSSVSSCTIALCDQSCPGRTNLPSPIGLLSSGSCITEDFASTRPNSEPNEPSYIFRNTPDCFSAPAVPTVGNDGRLTISLWIRPDVTTDGTIIERRSSNNDIIYALVVSSSSITFDYRTAEGAKFLQIQTGLQVSEWQHISVQVFGTKASIFIDGLEVDGTPFETMNLQGEIIDDSNGQTRIGQRISGTDQFVGRMQDLNFYQVTLTNREIEELATGTFPQLHVQSDCRCPDSHPRVNPLEERYCLKNGEPDTSADQISRLNQDSHPLQFANDGDLGSYWVSTLTNGRSITVDIDLGSREYQVFYVVLQFYSPQPINLTISHRSDSSSPWQVWQYYAQDCQSAFGLDNNGDLGTPTSVNCIQFPSDIPYSKGNITFQLLAPEPVARPGYNDFYNTPDLLEFVRAKEVRVVMEGHYHINPNSVRHMYYGIEELTISARCDCNGHADTCDITLDPYVCNCLDSSFTTGIDCGQCLPLYNDKPFRHGDQINAYNCKPCQCYGHASSCFYNETLDDSPDRHDRGGGGVCFNCQDNTQGQHCDECLEGFFRLDSVPLDSNDICNPCECSLNGTVAGDPMCEEVNGQCNCKQYTSGRTCDTCQNGYFNLDAFNPDGCEPCQCILAGTINSDISCHQQTGVCNCKLNVIGDKCDRCNYGFYDLAASNPFGCLPCGCDPDGSSSIYCDPTNGQCQCRSSTQGRTCAECRDGFYGLALGGCSECDCDDAGTEPGAPCNKDTGQCVCKANVQGVRCDQCAPSYYNLQASNSQGCSPCSCNTDGTVNGSTSCEAVTGQCECKTNVLGRTCNSCAPNTFGLDADNVDGCESCGCDATGTQTGSNGEVLVCDQNSGQCSCLTNRLGRICDVCDDGFYVPPSDGRGCLSCDCEPLSTEPNSFCNSLTGQCQCRQGNPDVTGRRCDSCLEEYFNFNPSTGMCSPCDCDPRGSVNTTCDSNTGQCECKDLVTGRRCDTCQTSSSNLQASNPQGCSKTPAQQPPPVWQAVNPFSILLTWGPPDEPNGNILTYLVYRNNTLVYNGSAANPLGIQQFEDQNLSPFTFYSYYVQSVNEAGRATSPMVIAQTPDAIPAGFDVLVITNVQARSADFSWSQPADISASVTQYILTSVTPSKPDPPTQHFSGLATSYQDTDLIPFTNYTFYLTVCTPGSCGQGRPTLAYTPMAPPQGVMDPNATALSRSSVFVSWDHPTEANGIITHYELFFRGYPGPDGIIDPAETRIFYPAGWYNPRPVLTPLEDPAEPPVTNFTHTGLDAFTRYQYRVTARNLAGTGHSGWTTVRTAEAAPLSTPAPSVLGVSSSELNISWSQPQDNEIRGVVISYKLYRYITSDDPFAPPEIQELVYSGDGNGRFFLLGGLQPYSIHSFSVEACNSIGCILSPRANGRTLPTAPEGQGPPLVDGFNSTVMQVIWNPPIMQNGPDPSYQVQRVVASLSRTPPRVERGARFTGGGYYLFSGNILPFSSYTGIEFEFRVTRPTDALSPVSALLMFAASDGEQEELIVVQLREGRPWFIFDPQGGIAGATPMDQGRTYDDGLWHKVSISRAGSVGSITVDDTYTGTVTAPTASTIIGETTGLYVGGLPVNFDLRRSETENLAVIRTNLIGCLRNIRIETAHVPTPIWRDLDYSSALERVQVPGGWQGCPTELERGVHFLGKGYLTLPEGILNGGNSFTLSLDIRTHYQTGLVLFGYHQTGSYLLIQIVGGNLQIEVSVGSGSPVVLSIPNTALCDGLWKSLMITKVGNQLSASINGGVSSGIQLSSSSLILFSSLHLGGVRDESEAAGFLDGIGVNAQGFGGCMRELTIDSIPVNLTSDMTDIHNIYLDGCPPVTSSAIQCADPQSESIYQGIRRNVTDSGLSIFTEYLYQVIASNIAGSTDGPWAAGRTREGAPTGLTQPIDPVSITGYVIQLQWQRPSGNTGLLTQYILSAYNQDLPDIAPVQAFFTDTTMSENIGNITDVVPYTDYDVTVTACTAGGCSESTSVSVRTREEAPSGVQSPESLSKTARTIVAGWALPERPNGVITSYQLQVDGVTVYTGTARNYTLTGLSVFNPYRLLVIACTQIGCSSSQEVIITTSQLPPSSVDPPTLFPRSPRSIEARWTAPSQPNGILQRYVLYSSTVSGVVGDPVFNTSDLFTDFLLDDLTPGTVYYMSVAACTGGGCTVSDQSSVRTEESIPEGVPAPIITATSPFELVVTWTHPTQPNGVIISYALVQNGIVIQNSTAMSYSASNLAPWSLHVFRVEACTSKGCTFGPEASGRTREAPPQGSIDLTVFTMNSRSVRATWTSPAQPNGMLVYEVLFTGLFYVAPEANNYAIVTEQRALYNGTIANEIVEVTGLIPYSAYSIQVRAYNTEGSILSNERTVTMPTGTPDGVLPPMLTATGPTSIQATWDEPARNNAPGVPSFQLRYRPANQPGNQIDVFSNSVRVMSYTLTGLQAFNEYEFRVIAINNAGQTLSEWASVFTREDVPGPIDPPMATDVQAYSTIVTWEFPDTPNGIITSIRLYQNNVLKTTLPGNVTQLFIDDLTPFTDYMFSVEMCNTVGCTRSPDSITYTTPQAAPTGQSPPLLSSPTPTSVQLSWSPPSMPNGILTGYQIERRHQGFTAIFSVVSVAPGAPRVYLDLSAAITPYTAYEYRVRVTNAAGSSTSQWASVITKEAPPGGVREPSVTVLGPDSVMVSWEEPAQSNGEILSYTIRMPDPRIYLDQTNLTSYTVYNLVPYTEYSVTIEACTAGGCTQSNPTSVRTDPTLPFGQMSPRGDAITQTYISVIWSPPSRPNGPNIRYELHRQKLRQPLSTGPVQGLNFWEFIYAGDDTTFQDFGLSTFTTYIYRITVYNDIGSVTSDPSDEVTTLAGQPTVAGTITAVAMDHISVLLNWTTPSLLELQGDVVNYFILVSSPSRQFELTYDPSVSGELLTSLMPNTEYEFRQVIFNGAFNITSLPAVTQTLDGAPEGFAAPLISVLSPSAVNVMWLPPDQPNGEITQYVIYLDGQPHGSVESNQLLYIMAGLQPYTVYSIQVEVCTVYDCLLSNITVVTTLEIPPAGVTAPNLRVLGPRAMEVSWASPASPNGIILGYEIQRREYQPCSDRPSTPSDGSDSSCGYVECLRSESVCGSQCYSGLQACCDGILHDTQPDYQCCDTNYLMAPVNASTPFICCGGQFHSEQVNYECCNGQYVQVFPGQICCPDPDEDRVAVGSGDACCAGVPYDSSGPQICCAGEFYDRSQGLCCSNVFHSYEGQFADGMSGQCCGGIMVSATMTCCSERDMGVAYLPIEGNVCCGTEYVNMTTSLCCTSETGVAETYTYDTPDARQLSNDQCCGSQRISPSQACCNEVGYQPGSRVCADRSSSAQGHCGIGTVCPISQAVSSFCDRCDFDTNIHTCYSVDAAYITSSPSNPGTPSGSNGLCPSALISIYTTGPNIYSYLDQGLSPYTRYEYLISAINAAGSSNSGLSNATTDEDIPSQVQSPEWSVEMDVLDTIQLAWDPPQQPNGIIVTYILRRDGIEIYRGADTSHNDNTGIQPFQHYSYILSACTRVGCAASQPVVAATLQAPPGNLFNPLLAALSSDSIQISWQEPGLPNGVIQGYSILLTGVTEPIYQGGPEDFQFTHTDLDPYTVYEYRLEACTSAGCSLSDPVSVRTMQDAPQGLAQPTHVVVSSTILELYWFEPSQPNGIITSYILYRNSELVYAGNNSVLMYVDTGLTPNTRYEYVVSALTIAGQSNSTIHVAQTPFLTPEGIPPPTLTVLSARSIRAVWTQPTVPNGVIRQYGIVILSGTPDERRLVSSDDTTLEVENLTPYTQYDMRVQVCIDTGCGVGPRAYARTFEAPPEEQGAPTLVSTGPSVVEVSWEPPAKPNGIIQQYFVYRRQYGTTQELLVFLTETEQSFVNAGGGLAAFNLYEYRVRAQNSQGTTDSPWASIRTQESVPIGIAAPNLVAVSPYAVQGTWSPPTSPNGIIAYYRIEYQERPNDPTATPAVVVAATVEATVLQTTFYGLLPFTSYQVRIVAINGAGETSGPWGPVTTLQGVPGDIGQFSVEQQSNGLALLLRWDEPGQPNGVITNYFIYEDEYLIAPIYTGLTREYLFRRLTPYTEYVVVLEACTSVGCGRGNPQTVRTAEVAPANQAPPTLGFVNSTAVVLNWKAPVDPNGAITQYDVIRRSARPASTERRKRNTDDSAFTVTVVIHSEYNTDAEDYTFVDNSLQPYRIYEYRIRSINSQGSVDSDWVQVETDQAAPLGVAPPTVNHITNTPGSLVIGWTPPTESNGIITGYRLQRNSSTPFSFEADYGFQFTDMNLQAFTIYVYTITVCTQGGCTTSSATSIRTLETAPTFVDPPSPVAISSSQIMVNWTVPSIASGEIVQYRLKVDDEVRYSGLGLSTTISGLIAHQEYTFVLEACTSGGCTDSPEALARPFEAPPIGMNPPLLRVLSATAIEASWSEPNEPNGIISRYELRRDGKLVYDGDAQRYQDFGDGGLGLTPGQQYSYVITAFNSRGHAISDAAIITTSSSSPAGLSPPFVTPFSSQIISATWQPPAFPNGEIQNYTLYVDNNIVYAGRLFSFDIRGLDFYTLYEIRVEACTTSGCALSDSVEARTFEHTPSDQVAPSLEPLADNLGIASGIRAVWNAPSNENGIILGYELYRRSVDRMTGRRSDPSLLINTTLREYVDMDPSLIPDETYEYLVVSFNSVGVASSPWASVRMLEAPPQGLLPPLVSELEATSLSLTIQEPSQPNGAIQRYVIYRNGTVLSQTTLTSYRDSDLLPYTTYSYSVEACTSGGCTTSDAVTVTTIQMAPSGLDSPVVLQTDSTWIQLSWDYPTNTNGIITKFQLLFRSGCPLTTQPFEQTCPFEDYSSIDKDLALIHNVTGLRPYTRYEFVVVAFNDAGRVESSPVQESTLSALPVFVSSSKPSISSNTNNSLITVNWAQSFVLNSMLREYILVENGDTVYSGIATTVTRPLKDTEYEFIVSCVTSTGSVSYPTIIYQPPSTGGPQPDAQTQWYSSVWFIAIMVLLGVVIIFILIAIVLSRTGTRKPYARERTPLPPRQRKAHNFTFSSMLPRYPESESILDPIPQAISRHSSMHSLHNTYYNPAFPAPSPPRPTSRTSEVMDKNSLKYLDDDDGVAAWDNTTPLPPKMDSGMVSLFEDDAMTHISQPYSYTKEQTMFTDTHL